MEKCDVCGKNSLLPEKFGKVNVCKICFMKAKGPSWRRPYDRHKDLQKHRTKAMEAMAKKNYPADVVEAIEDFFAKQVKAMTVCDGCGELVHETTRVGKAKMCSKCFAKINTSAWKEEEYEDNKYVEKNRKKVLKIASKRGYPQVVVNGINAHFDSKIQPGLLYVLNGGVGQKLKVFENHCVLITSDSFDVEEMSKRYGKALKNSRPKKSSFGANAAKALAFGAMIPSGGLLSTGVRAAASAAIMVVADKFIAGKGMFRVVKGECHIDYRTYSFADFAKPGNGDSDIGFIRFARNGGDPMDDMVFLFNYGQSKIQKAYNSICKSIAKVNDPEAMAPKVNVSVRNNIQNTQNNFAAPPVQQNQPPVSVADELLKFKQLLDMGAITQEEYEAKKKELLGSK